MAPHLPPTLHRRRGSHSSQHGFRDVCGTQGQASSPARSLPIYFQLATGELG